MAILKKRLDTFPSFNINRGYGGYTPPALPLKSASVIFLILSASLIDLDISFFSIGKDVYSLVKHFLQKTNDLSTFFFF